AAHTFDDEETTAVIIGRRDIDRISQPVGDLHELDVRAVRQGSAWLDDITFLRRHRGRRRLTGNRWRKPEHHYQRKHDGKNETHTCHDLSLSCHKRGPPTSCY